MVYIPLRNHTAYSLSEGAIQINDLIQKCVKLEIPSLAITDTTNLCGVFEFCQTSLQYGLKPIIGCKLNVCFKEFFSMGREYPYHDFSTYSSMVFLVKDLAGYSSIIRLSSLSYENAKKNKTSPFVSVEDVLLQSEGLLVLSGGIYGPIGKFFFQNKFDLVEKYVKKFQQKFPSSFYIEISRHNIEKEKCSEGFFLDIAHRLSIPIVATNVSYFLDKDTYEAHDALFCVSQGCCLREKERISSHRGYQFKSPKEMYSLFSDLPEAIENTKIIAERCSFKLKPKKPELPDYPGTNDEINYLKDKAKKGLEKRLSLDCFDGNENKNKITKEYFTRLNYEISVIDKVGFGGYFLIVSDFICWAKSQGIPVGPGRGSGAGSLVAWSLNITDIDPIKFKLLFERFLNPERLSMPDFDIDFCQERRDEVIDYVVQRYGQDRVSQIITFGTLQARAVLRDVGRVLEIPYSQVDHICKLIPYNPAKPLSLEQAIKQEKPIRDLINDNDSIKQLFYYSKKLEGLFRHASTHAAGIIISRHPLNDSIPLYYDPKGGLPATQFNMKDIEKLGFVKFDFLGLKTLSVIAKVQSLVKKIDINISNIPLNNKKTFDLLSCGNTFGIFQLEGDAMTDIVKKLSPTHFEEIIALVALYRPGPMDDIPRYIACKKGLEKIHYSHPSLAPILKETYGVMVYQEQVMRIAQELAGYNLGQADILRRAMGKKIKAVMENQRENFINGAMQNKIKKTTALDIFEQISKFAGYGFNKCHSAPYALISYQMAYLKANFTLEFYAASMTLDMANTEKIRFYIQEIIKAGFFVLQPDINISTNEFSVENRGIRFALTAIKGIGSNLVEELIIVRNRVGKFESIKQFIQEQNTKILSKKSLESLILSGVFDSLELDRALLLSSCEYILKIISSRIDQRMNHQGFLFTMDNIAWQREKKEYLLEHLLVEEFENIGFYISGHPLDLYVEFLKKFEIVAYKDIKKIVQKNETKEILMSGVVISHKIITSKKGEKFNFLQFSDREDFFEAALFSNQDDENNFNFDIGKILLLKVNVRYDQEKTRLSIINVGDIREMYKKEKSTCKVRVLDSVGLEKIEDFLSSCESGTDEVYLYIDSKDYDIVIDLRKKVKLGNNFNDLVNNSLNIEFLENVF